jgi:hypothetical protein
MQRISTRDSEAIAKAIANRERFTTHGALSGAPVTVGLASRLGWLPDEHRSLWRQGVILARNGHSLYAIWSYGTPIAWVLDRGTWQIPDERYSVTTSHHQSRVHYAIALAGEES